jgi:hypothetical protein
MCLNLGTMECNHNWVSLAADEICKKIRMPLQGFVDLENIYN